MKVFTTRRMVRAAVIAALYASMTIAFMPISYGPMLQFRISEALTILPLFCPEAVVGLAIGCFIANIFSPGTIILDMIFGTAATLIAAVITYLIGRKMRGNARCFLGILPPIIINAFVVPFAFFLTISELKEFYFISVLSVGAGQAVVLIVLGIPLYFVIKRLSHKLFE